MQNALTAIMEIKAIDGNYNPKHELKKLLLGRQHVVFGAVQRLGFVHFARFVFLRFGGKEYFAIITTYDFDFEDYMNIFIDELGEMFNEMLSASEHRMPIPEKKDAQGNLIPINVRHHRQEFIDYVREHRSHPSHDNCEHPEAGSKKSGRSQ